MARKARDYLIVLPVPHYASSETSAATESALAVHLKMFRDSLGGAFDSITIASPALSQQRYEQLATSWSSLHVDADGIRFVRLYEATHSTWRRLLATPAIALRLWRLSKTAGVIHTGVSNLFTPMENVALLFGWIRGRVLVVVEDIDWRESARMNLITKAWSRGVYWRRVHFHNRWRALQLHLARRFADVVMLKGRGLVEDFGRGAPNVHLILDAAHSRDMVVAETSLRDRTASGEPLRLVYFGRLTRYKGVTHMLRAVAAARRQGAGVTFDIFGSGEQESELRSLAAELGLHDIVRFNGSRPYGLPFLEELSEFDLLLAAPLSEDTPRSALDAQARGIPVLAYDTYYYRDLAAEGAGVVCSPWNDVDAFARRIVDLAERRAELQRLSLAAVRAATRNTQEIWLARRAEWTLAAWRARAR